MCLIAAAMVVGLSGCSDSRHDLAAAKPAAPATNDSAYHVDGIRRWYLTTSSPAADAPMAIAVSAPRGTETIDAWVGDLAPVRLRAEADGRFVGRVPLSGLHHGIHDVRLAANGSATAFARVPIALSAPYYVLVTADWDYPDPGQPSLEYQERLHAAHASLRITHFVGPYTFTDAQVSVARRSAISGWLRVQRDTFGDEIGLHIHPYCSFVESAGLRCITDQSTIAADDSTGYSIDVGAYGRRDFGRLLQQASALFEQHGLGRPTTFRAGDWAATSDTLLALADHGFVADSSAINWRRIEELRGTELYRLATERWASIGDTSQPYLSREGILEAPDNGAMVDYVSLEEMQDLFNANWNGEPLAAPVALTMGFHPASDVSEEHFSKVDRFLEYADAHLAASDRGPVVYITLADLAKALRR
jgi:hypothetical protein